MADRALEAILRLVADGRLTPEEAEPIIAGLDRDAEPARGEDAPSGPDIAGPHGAPRCLRIETWEGGRRVVNVTVPGGLATALVPGLAGAHAEQVRAALAAGIRGRIIEVGDDEDRVVISAE